MSMPLKEIPTGEAAASSEKENTVMDDLQKVQEGEPAVVAGSMELNGGKDKEERLRILDGLQVLDKLADGGDCYEELATKIEAPSPIVSQMDMAQSTSHANRAELGESSSSRGSLGFRGSTEASEHGRRSSADCYRDEDMLAEATAFPSLVADLVEAPTLAHATPLSNDKDTSGEEDIQRRRRKRRFVLFMAAGALLIGIVVGLSARLIPNDGSSSTSGGDSEGLPQDLILASPPPSMAPTQDISEIWETMTHFSYSVAVWGTAYTCLQASTPVINLSCRGSNVVMAIQVVGTFGSSCRRLGTNLVQCHAERAVTDLLEGVVLFACGTTGDESVEASSEIMPSKASECQRTFSTSGFSEVLGGVAVSYTNLGRFCTQDDSSSTEDGIQGSTLVLETSSSCIEGNQTTVEIDEDDSLSPQLYCFRSSECQTRQTCRPGEECTGESHCEVELPYILAGSSADTVSTSSCVFREAPAVDDSWSLVEEILDHRGRFLQSFLYNLTR